MDCVRPETCEPGNELDDVKGNLMAAVDEEKTRSGADGEAQEDESEEALECPPCETRAPKTVFNPMLPSKADVDSHNLTHATYRNWCPVCEKARGREDAHARAKEPKDGEENMPCLGMDYEYFGDAEDDTAKVTAIIRKDRQTGMICGNACSTKGPGDTWMIK